MAAHTIYNTGAADNLLTDKTSSLFQHYGYHTSAPHAVELSEKDAVNGEPYFGSYVDFKLDQHIGDYLGPIVLQAEMNEPENVSTVMNTPNSVWGWVDYLGYAMIEKLEVRSGDSIIETLTGEQLYIMDQQHKDPSSKHDFPTLCGTGAPLCTTRCEGNDVFNEFDRNTASHTCDRIIAYKDSGTAVAKKGKKMKITLPCFWTNHPSNYMPLMMLSAANALTLRIKLRPQAELLMGWSVPKFTNSKVTPSTTSDDALLSKCVWNKSPFSKFKLMCHNVQVTPEESRSLVMREHVRLISEYNRNVVTETHELSETVAGATNRVAFDLNFLHAVKELVITIKKRDEFGSVYDTATKLNPRTATARNKHLFAFHGGDEDPNYENWTHRVHHTAGSVIKPTANIARTAAIQSTEFTKGTKIYFKRPLVEGGRAAVIHLGAATSSSTPSITASDIAVIDAGEGYDKEALISTDIATIIKYDGTIVDISDAAKLLTCFPVGVTIVPVSGSTTTYPVDDAEAHGFVKLENIKLSLNGTSRQLDGQGISTDYLEHILQPLQHTNTRKRENHHAKSSAKCRTELMAASNPDDNKVVEIGKYVTDSLHMSRVANDAKNVFTYSFALAPEAANPSGHLNFTKVSHARLELTLKGFCDPRKSVDATVKDLYEITVRGVNHNWVSINQGRATITFQ